MTKIFSVNANNDIFATGTGRLAVAENLEAVLQQCKHVMSTRRSELPYAKGRGVQYFNNVFAGSPNLLQFEAEARQALATVPDIISVSEFSADIENNVLQYSVRILTIYGEGVISG